MKTRREFVQLSAAASLLAAARGSAQSASDSGRPPAPGNGGAARAYWCHIAGRLALPLLSALAERKLKATMPVEAYPTSKDRPEYTYLEGLGRLLTGIAPWLELG